jgi:hypothetical protein
MLTVGNLLSREGKFGAEHSRDIGLGFLIAQAKFNLICGT